MVYIRNYARIVRQGGDHSKKATLHPQHLHPKSRSERETVKARAALVKSLEDRETLHTHVKLSLASRRMQLQYKCLTPWKQIWNGWFQLFKPNVQDSHTRAWTCVREFMDSNMRVFTGRTSDPESTVLPAISSWIDTTLEDCCVGADGFSLVIFLNAPSCGIVGTEKQSFFVTAITNLLTQFRRTAIALIVLPNRAGQQNATRRYGLVNGPVGFQTPPLVL